jgi:hypothetical protein
MLKELHDIVRARGPRSLLVVLVAMFVAASYGGAESSELSAGNAISDVSAALAGAPAHGSWADVQMLERGARLRVTTTAGAVTGQLESATDTSIDLRAGNNTTHVPRTDIRRVERAPTASVGRGARKGFLIGALSGAALGVAAVRSNRAAWISVLALSWGGIGAAIGAADAAAGQERVLIYERPAAPGP